MVTHPPVIQESSEDHLSPKQVSQDKPTFTLLDNNRLKLNEKLQQEDRRPYSDPVSVSHSSVLNGSYIGDMARSLGHYEHDHFLSFAHFRHSSSLPNMQDVHVENQEKSDKLTSETGDAGSQTKNVAKLDTESGNDIGMNNVLSSKETESKVLADGEESQEIQNFMENRVSMTTELEDSDDSHTLTDDSASQDGEFTFPPLEELESVSASPVPMMHHEPVTVSETFSNKMSIFRPNLKSSKQEPSTSKNTDLIKQWKKSKLVPNDGENTVSCSNQSKRSCNSNSISTSKSSNAEADGHVKHSSTESIVSNMSFPSPQKHSLAFLPLSSSAIDMSVIFQRLVWIGKALCQTFSPIRRAVSFDQSNPTTSSSEEELHFQPQSYKCRQKLYDGFLDCLCSTVCAYADNMLCMDLCGTSSSTASRLAGPRLVEYLQTQRRSGLIWGCRHNTKENRSCFEYMDKRTNFLCDRHEPITRDMCTRINNVMAILTFLEIYHRRLGNVFGVYGDWSVKQKKELNMSINSLETLRSDFIVVDNYGYDPSGDRMDVFETVSQKYSGAELSSTGRPQVIVSSPIDSYKSHLMAVLRAQSRLIAYRVSEDSHIHMLCNTAKGPL